MYHQQLRSLVIRIMRAASSHGGLTLAQTAVCSPSSCSIDSDYVLACEPLAHRRGLALALSTYTLQLRSFETLALQYEVQQAHASTIHEIWTSSVVPHQLATCSSDKSVKLWDTRSTQPSMVVPVGHEVWSLSLNSSETLLVAGTDDCALFFDVRTGQRLGAYGESHVDAVTQVRFHPTRPAFVATASEDGVVCLFDSRLADEDEALESSVNVESAVTTMGFFGPQLDHIYCLTGSETIDLWNVWTAARLHHYDTIRDDCNARGLATDYLIDCVYDDASNELFVLAGSHEGDLNAVSIGMDVADAGKLQHTAALRGGHTACVRCIHFDKESSTLYTGGEDTRLCKWTVPSAADVSADYSLMSASTAFGRKAKAVEPAGIRKVRKASRPY